MNDVDTARNIIYLSGDITEETVPDLEIVEFWKESLGDRKW